MAIISEHNLQTGHPLRFIVAEHETGKSLVRIIVRRYPQLRPAAVYQALRKRDIKVNEQRQRTDRPVAAGDVVVVYLPPQQASQQLDEPDYAVVNSSGPVWVIKKRPGLSVQTGAGNKPQGPTLLELLRQDKSVDSCLCHRLDRQTGGLLIAAADLETCRLVRQQMAQGLIVKRYTCLVRGVPNHGSPVVAQDGLAMLEVSAWLEKQASSAQVFIHDEKQRHDQPITTRYRVEQVFRTAGPGGEPVSELTVELVTGRTHQIRAHLADSGHPLLGDGKYGRNDYNRFFHGKAGTLKHQELWATALLFDKGCSGPLTALSGQTIRIEPDFAWIGYVR